jgi:hypothetical protein
VQVLSARVEERDEQIARLERLLKDKGQALAQADQKLADALAEAKRLEEVRSHTCLLARRPVTAPAHDGSVLAHSPGAGAGEPIGRIRGSGLAGETGRRGA